MLFIFTVSISKNAGFSVHIYRYIDKYMTYFTALLFLPDV